MNYKRYGLLPRYACFILVLTMVRAGGLAAQDSVKTAHTMDGDCWWKENPGWDACRAKHEAPLFRTHPSLARRTKDGLVLTLVNGQTVLVRDSTGEGPGNSSFWLEDVDQDAGYFIIGERGYEYRGSIAVSRKNGWRYSFEFDFPVFSSDGRYAAAAIPLATAFWHAALDVFSVTPDSLIREFTVDSEARFSLHMGGDTLWGPTPPHWVGHELRFRSEQTGEIERSRCPRNDYRCEYWFGDSMAVTKTDGKWQVRRMK
jgi:hypothetical protein